MHVYMHKYMFINILLHKYTFIYTYIYIFPQYFQDGGTLINFTSSLDEWFVTKSSVSEASTVVNMNYESWNDVCVISGRHEYSDVTSLMDDVVIDVRATNSQTRNAVVIQAEHLTTGGIAVLSQVRYTSLSSLYY